MIHSPHGLVIVLLQNLSSPVNLELRSLGLEKSGPSLEIRGLGLGRTYRESKHEVGASLIEHEISEVRDARLGDHGPGAPERVWRSLGRVAISAAEC
jgi:hypothetical protein